MGKRSRRLLGAFLSLVLALGTVLGLAPREAKADDTKAYVDYDVTTDENKDKSDDALTALQVTFNGTKWYVIEDDSTAINAGTLTLLAADNIGTSKFHDSSNVYSTSTIRGVLDGMTAQGGSFAEVKDAIVDVNLEDVGVANAKLYLLSNQEAEELSDSVRLPGTWWLRTPSGNSNEAWFVREGRVLGGSGPQVSGEIGVRPALKLNLESVVFKSESKEFSLSVNVTGVTLVPSDAQTIDVGDKVSLVATVEPDDATDKSVVWRVDGDAVTLYSDESCENEVGTDATDALTVWAKGVTAGAATVTCASAADGTKSASYDVTVQEPVAEVDGTGYADFSAAVAAWNDAENGSTLKLLADVQTTSTINVSNKKVLDLNGHGIANNRTCPVITVAGGDLTLNDSDKKKDHKFSYKDIDGAGLAKVDDSLESGYSVFSGGYITGGRGVYDGNYSYGGGILLRGGSATMNAGNIIGNLAQRDDGYGRGGAVAMRDGATFTMNGGSVMYNACLRGDVGAFHVSSSNLYVNGGTIANNYCCGAEGDVFVWHTGGIGGENGTLYLSGSPLISGNIGEWGGGGTETRQNAPNTVYVASDQIKEIRVTGPLTPDEPIGLSFKPEEAPLVFTASDNVQYNETEDFKCEIPGYAVGKNAEGQLFLDSSVTVTFDANGYGMVSPLQRSQDVASGSLVAKPDDPTADGWVFGGWYRETSCQTAWVFERDTVIDATTLYAKWERRQATVSTVNLTLGGELGLNFYLSVPDSLAGGAKAAMDGPGGPREAELALQGDGRYMVSYPVSAIRADQDVTFALLDADNKPIPLLDSRGEELEGNVVTYSVYGYLQAALADGSTLTEDEKAQVRATYTYCAHAVRWKYGTALPEGINELPDLADVQAAVAAHKATQEGTAPEGLKVTGITLLLDSDTSLRLYFTCEGDVPGVTLDGAPVTPVQLTGTSKYYVEASRIGVSRLDRQYSVRFGDEYEVQVRALSYVHSALRSAGSSQELKDVCGALFDYGRAFSVS